jgi:ATP-binding cassette, subfamily B, multidrug efflux pump
MTATDVRKPTPSAGEPPIFGRFGPGPRSMEKARGAKDTRTTLLRLWGYLRRQSAILFGVSLLVVVTSFLTLLGPFLLGRAIDRYILPHNLPGLAHIAALMLTLYLLTSLSTWLQSYFMAGVAQRAISQMRNDMFAVLQRLPLRFFDTHPHGDLMSRLTNDVENVNQALTDTVTSIVSGLLGLVGATVMMFRLSVPLAAVTVPALACMSLLSSRWLAQFIRAAFRRQQAALGALNGLIEETLGGQRVVKAYGREADVTAKFAHANAELRQAATRAQMVSGFIGPLMNCTGNSGVMLVAGVGGLLALKGAITVGGIAAFINYTRQFGRPINDIANLYNVLQGALAGAERVFELIDETPETDSTAPYLDRPLRGDVVFDNVSFAYQASAPVLKGITLHARPGETVALIGPTGAGKTTIINLLTRFYEIDAGQILIDGQDIRELHKDELRRNLGLVLQDTFLFAGTVRENIRYGRLDASDEEVVAAAQLANANGFIQRLPQGYDTPLAERGGNVSQGQRQLLAIARAALADPRILILDEATSSVDTRTEKRIQQAMQRLMAGRTSFVIAHRLSTIREADQILVIDGGRIIEHGTHLELLAHRGFYYRLTSGRYGETADDAVETTSA